MYICIEREKEREREGPQFGDVIQRPAGNECIYVYVLCIHLYIYIYMHLHMYVCVYKLK